MKKIVKLNDIFDFKIASNGSFLTKEFVNKNKGNIPVYGASKIKDEVNYGYISDSLKSVKYFENILTINRNGSVGNVFYRKNKFVINSDVTPLVLKSELFLSKEYLSIVINEITTNKFTYSNKAGKNELKEIEIEIPVKEDGSFDLDKQREFADKYLMLESKKNELLAQKQKLKDIQVELINDYLYKEIKLNTLFDIVNGETITQDYINKNKGIYPVYSSKTTEDGCMGYINKYMYDGKYITYTTRGNAGEVFFRKGKFNCTNNCGILLPKFDLAENSIDMEYLTIQIDFKSIVKGYGLKQLSISDINKSNIIIKLPVNENGEYDIKKQKEIVEKYNQIDFIKNEIDLKIEELLNYKISIDI